MMAIVWPYRKVTDKHELLTGMMTGVWPVVRDGHRQAGELARGYYDRERQQALGTVHPFYRAQYSTDWFIENLSGPITDLHRAALVAAEKPEKAAAAESAARTLVLASLREVQQGGRATIVRGVDSDPEALGWARVETGSSCAFCTLAISRGPVFQDGEAAGERNAWHLGCDCRAVPVLDRDDWPGRDQYLKAEAAYREAAKDAKRDNVTVETALRRRIEGRA